MEAAMASGDPEYYARRAAKERAMAEAAKDPSARAAHDALAARYEAKAKGDVPPIRAAWPR